MPRLLSRLLPCVAIAVSADVAGARSAFASPPLNNFFVNATPMSPLPFTDTGDLNGTDTEPGELQFWNCSPMEQTVWYRLPASPTAKAIVADLNGSNPGVLFNVWVDYGGGLGSLGFLGCTFVGGSVQFTTQPNVTYYIQAGSVATGPANLQLNVQQVPPPANDDFVDAKIVGPRPFVDPVDLTSATTEPGEPMAPGGFFTIEASAWYAFTPEVTESVTASLSSCCVGSVLAVFTGSSLQDLTEVAARYGSGQLVTFQAVAGTPYYIQLGRGSLVGGTAQMTFRLEAAPPPVANFYFFPFDASIYNTVQFMDMSFDPANVGFASQVWQFGDGTSASEPSPSHRYAADGDYAVGFAVATLDGRTASSSQVLHVRTHDVAITKFTVPTSAKAGQTREITIGVRNTLYPENVQFQLSKGVPGGGLQTVGTLTQLIPVRPGNKTVPVTLSYTFSNDDALVGKVTFQVTAEILGVRDAIPADNTAIAAPTRVNP